MKSPPLPPLHPSSPQGQPKSATVTADTASDNGLNVSDLTFGSDFLLLLENQENIPPIDNKTKNLMLANLRNKLHPKQQPALSPTPEELARDRSFEEILPSSKSFAVLRASTVTRQEQSTTSSQDTPHHCNMKKKNAPVEVFFEADFGESQTLNSLPVFSPPTSPPHFDEQSPINPFDEKSTATTTAAEDEEQQQTSFASSESSHANLVEELQDEFNQEDEDGNNKNVEATQKFQQEFNPTQNATATTNENTIYSKTCSDEVQANKDVEKDQDLPEQDKHKLLRDAFYSYTATIGKKVGFQEEKNDVRFFHRTEAERRKMFRRRMRHIVGDDEHNQESQQDGSGVQDFYHIVKEKVKQMEQQVKDTRAQLKSWSAEHLPQVKGVTESLIVCAVPNANAYQSTAVDPTSKNLSSTQDKLNALADLLNDSITGSFDSLTDSLLGPDSSSTPKLKNGSPRDAETDALEVCLEDYISHLAAEAFQAAEDEVSVSSSAAPNRKEILQHRQAVIHGARRWVAAQVNDSTFSDDSSVPSSVPPPPPPLPLPVASLSQKRPYARPADRFDSPVTTPESAMPQIPETPESELQYIEDIQQPVLSEQEQTKRAPRHPSFLDLPRLRPSSPVSPRVKAMVARFEKNLSPGRAPPSKAATASATISPVSAATHFDI